MKRIDADKDMNMNEWTRVAEIWQYNRLSDLREKCSVVS